MAVSIEELDEVEASSREEGRAEGIPRVPIGTALQTLVSASQDGMCPSLSQVAGRLGQTVNSGAFRNRMASCNHYGMTERAGAGSIRITDLGRRLLDERTRGKALVESWMRIGVFAAIFELYDGTKLPASSALDADLARMGVPAKQVVPARRILVSGAETVGLLNASRDRMVMPSFTAPEPETETPAPPPAAAGAALSKTAALADLGTVTISADLQWMDLPEPIREKLFSMIDDLAELERLAGTDDHTYMTRDPGRGGDAPILLPDTAEQAGDTPPP